MEQLVLSDELFVLLRTYHTLSQPNKQQRRLYQKLLQNIAPLYKTNFTQIKRCEQELDPQDYQSLKEQYLKSDNKENLQQLAAQTRYKLILTTDPTQTELPYLNINEKTRCITKNYVIKLEPNVSREKLIDYLTQL